MSAESQIVELNVAYLPTPYVRAMHADLVDIAEVCDGIHIITTEADFECMPLKIKSCIDIAHDLNLVTVVVLGGYGNLFETLGAPSSFTALHPELNCVTNKNRPIPKSCPNRPAVRAFLRDTIRDLTEKFNMDGFLLNKPNWRLPPYLGQLQADEWACRCDDCAALFKEHYQKDMPVAFTAEVAEFQANSLRDLVADVCGQIKVCGTHLITSVRVSAGDTHLRKRCIGASDHLDVFGVDVCWRPTNPVSEKEFVDHNTEEHVRIARANGTLAEAWVCTWGAGAAHANDAYRAAKFATAHNINCLSAWSYKDSMSWTPVDETELADPDEVWDNLRQAYHEIRTANFEIYDYKLTLTE